MSLLNLAAALILTAATWLSARRPDPLTPADQAIARDIQAIAEHIRHADLADPARERIHPADRPPPDYPVDVFTSGELEHLASIEQWLHGMPAREQVTVNGRAVTSVLLTYLPDADTTELGRVLLALLRAAEPFSCSAPHVFTYAVAAAALDLTDIERSVAR